MNIINKLIVTLIHKYLSFTKFENINSKGNAIGIIDIIGIANNRIEIKLNKVNIKPIIVAEYLFFILFFYRCRSLSRRPDNFNEAKILKFFDFPQARSENSRFCH